MTLRVVLLPDTVLLVPGAAGRADVVPELRAAAVEALAAALRPGVPLHVVAPARRDRDLGAPVAPGLGAAGLPDGLSGAPGTGGHPDVSSGPAPAASARADVPASVALALIGLAAGPGATAGAVVHEVARTAADVTGLRARGAALARTLPGPATLVVVGSLSARHGPDAPLAEHPLAPAADEALLAALATGPEALAAALEVLGPREAADLAVSGWGPWQVLLGALAAVGALPAVGALVPSGSFGPRPAGTVARVTAALPYGAQHAVVAWTPSLPSPAARTEEPR